MRMNVILYVPSTRACFTLGFGGIVGDGDGAIFDP